MPGRYDRLLKFLSLLAIVFIVAGCAFGGHDIEARVSADFKKLAVVPFREKDLYFLESKHGADVAGLVVSLILKNALDSSMVDPKPAFDMIRDVRPEKINWGDVATVLNVDYIVIGTIGTFRSRDPVKDVNCFRGEMTVDVSVWKPDNSMVLRETVKARHPSDKFSAPVISVFDTSEEEVLGRLKWNMAMKISKFFYPHSPDDD